MVSEAACGNERDAYNMRKAVTKNTMGWITHSHVQLGMQIDMSGATHIMRIALMRVVGQLKIPTYCSLRMQP